MEEELIVQIKLDCARLITALVIPEMERMYQEAVRQDALRSNQVYRFISRGLGLCHIATKCIRVVAITIRAGSVATRADYQVLEGFNAQLLVHRRLLRSLQYIAQARNAHPDTPINSDAGEDSSSTDSASDTSADSDSSEEESSAE